MIVLEVNIVLLNVFMKTKVHARRAVFYTVVSVTVIVLHLQNVILHV